MKRHSCRKMKGDIQCIVKRLGEKFDQRGITPTEPVNIIGPVYKQPAPDHYGKHGKVDPVKPPDG